MRRYNKLLYSMNRIIDGLFDFINFIKCYLLNRKVDRYHLSSGIIAALETDSSGKIRRISLTRDQRKFQRVSPADTLYSVSYSSQKDWNIIITAIRTGASDLPPGYAWHSETGRLIKMLDGEVFSLSEEDALSIDAIIQAHK